ncbi:MAG: hypothetical protein AAB592_04770 [Patescibacteria group bacterium]
MSNVLAVTYRITTQFLTLLTSSIMVLVISGYLSLDTSAKNQSVLYAADTAYTHTR